MRIKLPQETVFYLLERAIKLYRKSAQDTINGAGYNISINQLILIITLNERPDASQVELAELIFKDFASVTRMVDILVKKGFINRIENSIDRRKKDLTPTLKCKKMLVEVIPLVKKYRKNALKGFSKNEISQVTSFLEHFANNCTIKI